MSRPRAGRAAGVALTLTTALVTAVTFGAAAGCAAPRPLSMPEVSGAYGQRPQVVLPSVAPPRHARTTLLREGDGPAVRAGQVVVTDVDIRVWQGNRPLLDTYRTRQPTTAVLDGRRVSTSWNRALVGRRAGSRVLLVAPATQGFGPHGMPPAQVSPDEHLVLVFDVIGGYGPRQQVPGATAPRAEPGPPSPPAPGPRTAPGADSGPPASEPGSEPGPAAGSEPGPAAGPAAGSKPGSAAPRAPEGSDGDPAVTVRPGGEPRLSGWGRAPGRPGARILITGRGAPVGAGDTVVVQYTGVVWGGSRPFGSTYRRGGPKGFVLREASLLPGWYEGLAGRRVGSRVLLTVPADHRPGFIATPGGMTAPPGKAVAYVVDILDRRARRL